MKLLQRTISIVLTVVGAALLAMGTVLWWADGHLFDTASVVAQTDDVLESPDVQVLLTARITDHVMVYVGDPTFRPQVEMIVEEAVGDPRVRALVNDGVRQAHQALVSGDAEQVALRLEALSREIRQTVVVAVPELEGRIPDTDVLTFDLITRSDLPDVWRLAERFHEAAAMFLSIGAVLVGVGLVIGPARWLRLLVGGLTFAAFGAVMLRRPARRDHCRRRPHHRSAGGGGGRRHLRRVLRQPRHSSDRDGDRRAAGGDVRGGDPPHAAGV